MPEPMGEVSPIDRLRRRGSVDWTDASLRPHRFAAERRVGHRPAEGFSANSCNDTTRLTLLAAGAGMGKTAALAIAIQEKPADAAGNRLVAGLPTR